MRKTLVFVLSLAGFLSLGVSTLAQEQFPRVTSNYLILAGGGAGASEPSVAWSSLALRTYTFTPPAPDQSACISIINNNPTNSHTFTLAVFQSGDPNVANFTNNAGRFIADAVVGTPSPVPALGITTSFVHSNAAAKMSVQFTGGATAAGSPDTADIFVTFTTAVSCGPAQSGVQQVSLPLFTASTVTANVSAPAVSTQAAFTVPARPGFRHVINCISFSASASTAPVATGVTVDIVDSSAGIIFVHSVVLPASVGELVLHSVCGLNLALSVNTTFTVQWTAAVTNVFESINCIWFDVLQ